MVETNQSSFGRLSLSEWLVSVLRLTAFPVTQTNIDHLSYWWEKVFREPPELELTQPKQGIARREGLLEEKKLVLSLQPTRLDWGLTFGEPKSVEQPNIGPLPDALDIFCELMSRWFAELQDPPIKRLAFGAILFSPIDDREMGYRQLQPYFGSLELDPVNSSDFLYQINRPRNTTTEIPELRINRLSKWSVSNMALLQISNAGISSTPSSSEFSCRLEVDINTAADYQNTLPQQQLPSIFRELVSLGQEIIQEGDIP